MADRDRCRVESIIGILADQSNDPADRCRWAIEACGRALDRADPEPPQIREFPEKPCDKRDRRGSIRVGGGRDER